jgi:hypothetical protein
MKREFKFRAWHEKQNRMIPIYGMGPDFLTEDTLDGVNPGWNCLNTDELDYLTVMQATVYKDQKKQTIFEGDICKDRFGRIMQVYFQNGRLQWQCDDEGNNFKYADLFQWIKKGKGFAKNETILSVDVIGNIYENHELIK